VAQGVEKLPCKHKDLTSNPSSTKKKNNNDNKEFPHHSHRKLSCFVSFHGSVLVSDEQKDILF
jgi:hypothetical protein